MILDQAGNLYGATSQGGAGGNGVVFKLTRGSEWLDRERALRAFTGGDDGKLSAREFVVRPGRQPVR